jgi:4-hydroxythreonine-4-phosphate dehydrogenase
MPLPRIAIATGDPAGIGPEIALKAVLDARVRSLCRPLLVGDPAVVEMHARTSGLSPNIHVLKKPSEAQWSDGTVELLDACDGSNVPVKIGTVDAAYGRASLASAGRAIKAALPEMSKRSWLHRKLSVPLPPPESPLTVIHLSSRARPARRSTTSTL